MISDAFAKPDQRYRLANMQVLIVDSNKRAAQLVRTLLRIFGIRRIENATSAQEALQILRSQRFDLLITEQALEPSSGTELVRTIRNSKLDPLIKHDIAIIMLTGHSAVDEVVVSRDAGITEFVAKPFSAATLAARLIEIIDNPRAFVETPDYVGPTRRRQLELPEDMEDRRKPTPQQNVHISRPSRTLIEMIGPTPGAEILSPHVIEEAQTELMKSEPEYIELVKQDLISLDKAYAALEANPGDSLARKRLLKSAYAIKSEAGIFGYAIASAVADQLIQYMRDHDTLSVNSLIVARKQIDTIATVFAHQVKDSSDPIGLELIDTLNKLVAKFA